MEQRQVWAELRRFFGYGTGLVLGTLGEGGAVLFDGQRFYHSNAAPVTGTFVDTMGCGDAYLTAFVVSMLVSGWRRSTRPAGAAIHRAMKYAARFAAQQCTVEGAFGLGRAIVPQPAV
jgi:fructoselysine 6-kinase